MREKNIFTDGIPLARVQEEILEVPDPTGKNTEDYHEFITIAHQEAERILHEVYRQDVF